jgi:hypothetical protein
MALLPQMRKIVLVQFPAQQNMLDLPKKRISQRALSESPVNQN